MILNILGTLFIIYLLRVLATVFKGIHIKYECFTISIAQNSLG